MKVVKNPEMVDAVIFNNDATTYEELKQLGYGDVHLDTRNSIQLVVSAPVGEKRANIGDYIVKESFGNFYVYSPDEFKSLYGPIFDDYAMKLFVEDCLDIGGGKLNIVSSIVLYRHFLEFCNIKKLFMVNPTYFDMYIRSCGFIEKIISNNDTIYSNIRLKNKSEVTE